MVIWMKVTQDIYELPLMIADSAQELADMCGVGVNAIYSGVSKNKTGKMKHGSYRKVEYPLTKREIEAKKRHRKMHR